MIQVQRGVLEGRLRAPPSKSHTHRAFLLGALSGNGSIHNALESEDTEATLRCLEALGFLVSRLPHEVRVGGGFRAPKKPLHAGASGTTLRLLTAFACLAPGEARLDADPQLRRRPMGPLLSALEALGARTTSSDGFAPLTVRGPLQGGPCRIPGDVSSQFVSALLLATPAAPRDSTIEVVGPLASRPYVDLTLAQMRDHGVRVEADGNRFLVPGDQKIRQRPIDVPGDWSSAAFLLVAAAISGGTVTVEGLKPDDPQGDRAILGHLEAFGAKVSLDRASVTVGSGSLSGRDIDVGATPDLFPALCALAALSQGASRLFGAPHLRLKESDRVHAMATNLARAGVRVEELPDGLLVHGGTPNGIKIESFNDHRIAMAMAVVGLRSSTPMVLEDDGVVRKSYPGFAADLARLAPRAVSA